MGINDNNGNTASGNDTAEEFYRELQMQLEEIRQAARDARRGDVVAHVKAIDLLHRFVLAAFDGRKMRDELAADFLEAIARHIERVQFEAVGRMGRN